jgi:two-component system, NarL family, sensor histidine kinase DesK
MAELNSIVEPVRPQDTGVGRSLRMAVGLTLGLLFLTAPMNDLARSSLPAGRIAGIAVGFAAFVALYVTIMRTRRSLRPSVTLAALAVLAALPAALLAAGAPQSFGLLFVFFAAAVGMRLRPEPALFVIGVTAAGVAIATRAEGESVSTISAKALTVIAIGFMMTAFNRQIRVNRELRTAREELSRLAVSEERLRIARDLHDLLGHSLSVVTLKTELAARLLEREPAKAAAELADVQAVSRQALAEVREAVQGYRQLGLADALDGARTALTAAGIDCELDETHVELPPDVESVLAWAVREGTTNVVRHSRAGHCAVRIRGAGDEAVVEIEDDGAPPRGDARAGSGLSGLAERAERVRGRLEAGAVPGGGFRLRLTVPLQS